MVVVQSGRNPFAIFLLFAALASGISGLIDPHHTSGAVARLLPGWELLAWYAGLAASSAITLTGLALRGLTSLLVERLGLTVLGLWSVAYSLAVISVVDAAPVTFAAMITFAFAAACVARAVRITKDLARVTRRSTDPDGRPPARSP